MQMTLCRLRNHQWCFILFNILLFHALLFGTDLVEEYFLQSSPNTYTDMNVLEIRDQARKLDMELIKMNISRLYHISNAQACSGQDIFLLTVIFSNAENKTRRDAIRTTWANLTNFKGYTILTVFALGEAGPESRQSEIEEEFQIYGDIIQGKFLDSFDNKIRKIVMTMEWTVTFCSKARFILKTEEDVFVNYVSLVDYLLILKRNPEDLYIGRVIHQQMPIREPQSVGFVSVTLYPEESYPDYCSGTAFVVSQDVARKVYVVSKKTAVPVPHDVFVGICANKAGVVPTHSSRFSGDRHISYNRCCYKFIFTSSKMVGDEFFTVWKDINDGKNCSIFETYSGLVSCKISTYLDKFTSINFDLPNKDGIRFND
ncbi:beta-1,3-galactosyltransferase 9 [Protopterus annectens]|uniref:beta-1,3-galactosyltransferase 9 n=1 Tax=Protopterus annectens TaxID=7888 RepID=UPI001CF93673|nr:beta-1,3-galactosyltransferase 9 [Protopterus annectens]